MKHIVCQLNFTYLLILLLYLLHKAIKCPLYPKLRGMALALKIKTGHFKTNPTSSPHSIRSSSVELLLFPSSISNIDPPQPCMSCPGNQQLQYIAYNQQTVTSPAYPSPKPISEYPRMSFQHHFTPQCPFDLGGARSALVDFFPTRALTLAALSAGADTVRQDQWSSSEKFEVRRL